MNDVWLLYVPILVWSLLLIIYFIFLTLRFTCGKWEKQANPYCNETLGMPKGTLRGILTLTILFVAILLEVFTLSHPEHEKNTAQFIVAFQMVLAFYFGSQVMNQVTTAEKEKTQAVANSFVDAEKAKNAPAGGSGEFREPGSEG